MGEPTAQDMLQMAGQLLESAELLSGAQERLAGATRTLNALAALAASWEKQARAAGQAAWHSPRDGYRAEALAACAAELRQTVEKAVREQLEAARG